MGQHQVTKDATRVERSVAVTLMAYLVLLGVRAHDIRPGLECLRAEAPFRVGG